jgi:hypothetical protein
MGVVHKAPVAPQRARRKAAISFAIAVAAAIFSAFDLHGWHIYIGLGLALVVAAYGLLRWRRKYPKIIEDSAGVSSKV